MKDLGWREERKEGGGIYVVAGKDRSRSRKSKKHSSLTPHTKQKGTHASMHARTHTHRINENEQAIHHSQFSTERRST